MKQFVRYGALAVTLLFVSVSLFLLNCSKKAAGNDLAENGSGAGYGFYSSCGDPLNGTTVLEVIRNDHDPIDDKITLIQYHYARALRQVLKNSAHRCLVVNALMASTSVTEKSLLDLAQENASFASALNAELRNSVNATSSENIYPRGMLGESDINQVRTAPTWDANSYLGNKMINSPFRYDPVVHFVKKPASCEAAGPVTVLIGQDVDDCDDVAGWHGDDEVVMSERDVQSSDEIIIMVGPGKALSLPNPIVGDGGSHDSETVSDRAPGDLNSTLRRVNAGFRFENLWKSDVQAYRILYQPSSAPPFAVFSFQDVLWGNLKFTKSQIAASTTFTNVLPAFVNPPSALTDGSFIHTVVYEYDWWAPSKAILNPCHTPFSVLANLKFASEFWANDCGLFSTLYPAIGSTRATTAFDGTGAVKGVFTFARSN